MGPLILIFIAYYGTALVFAVPTPTTVLSLRQVVQNPAFLGSVSSDSTATQGGVITTPRPQLSTRLGLPTGPTTVTETSITTNTVPSSTTTRTFTERSIVATSTSTFVIDQTIETTLSPQTIANPVPSVAEAVAGVENGAVGFAAWNGGTTLNLAVIIGLLLTVNPW